MANNAKNLFVSTFHDSPPLGEAKKPTPTKKEHITAIKMVKRCLEDLTEINTTTI